MTTLTYRYRIKGLQDAAETGGDWRGVEWSSPDPDCPTCLGNPYWGKTLSSWERCKCTRATRRRRSEG